MNIALRECDNDIVRGEQFGQARIMDALRDARSAIEDVDRATEALNAHLGDQSPSDDITIASFEISAGPGT